MKKMIVLSMLAGLVTISACKKEEQPAQQINVVVAVEAPKAATPESQPVVNDDPEANTEGNPLEEFVNDDPEANTEGNPLNDGLPEFGDEKHPLGLVLAVPSLPKGNVVSDDMAVRGIYNHEEIVDGAIVIGTARLNPIGNTKAEIVEDVEKWLGNPYDIEVQKESKISSRLSYPTWKITYLTGENEDTKENIDYLIQTDEFSFRFHTAASADQMDQYRNQINTWANTMKLIEVE